MGLQRLLVGLVLSLAGLSAQAEVTVLTSIRPLALIAAAVQDGVGEPVVLLPPGASPHDYSLRPSDRRALADAHLFYWVGPDLERFLMQPLASREGVSLAVETLPGMQLLHFATADNHDEVLVDSADDHDHQPGQLDAHLWLSSDNAFLIAARMAEDLVRADAEHADRYRDNLARFKARLAQADARVRETVAPVLQRPTFVLHDTYQYFQNAYGLLRPEVLQIQTDVAPGARRLSLLRDRLRAVGSTCVFTEPPPPQALLSSLTRDLPVRVAVLDAQGASQSMGAEGYPGLLERLAQQWSDCLEAGSP